MSQVLRAALTFAVAAHMVCGCCWHHAHADGHGHRSDLPGAAAGASPCDDDDQRPEGQWGGEDRQRGGHDPRCGEHPCAVARPGSFGRPNVLAGLRGVSLPLDFPRLILCRGTGAFDAVVVESQTPVPLHLLKQVLLL